MENKCCMCGEKENVEWREPDGYYDVLPHYGYYCTDCAEWYEEEYGDEIRADRDEYPL